MNKYFQNYQFLELKSDNKIAPLGTSKIELTSDLKISSFFQQQINVGEVIWNEKLGISHEIQYVPKHAAIAVNEIVLLEWIQYDRNGAIEEFGEARIGIFGEGLQGARVDRAAHIDVHWCGVSWSGCDTRDSTDRFVVPMVIGACGAAA